ncbi:hypothetical protein [Pseudomonas fluorescens]|uniref:Uncharacterized protein n=1 Tax=Pseudomonas fluorescens TaxID=294 RepID=A0A5E7AW80_PSEFL|nr:hypothetical protein [Pseudomonas fluorescens]VVN79541.1 hypothetical protein PS691_00982 [Pseudomonas fluorescens]
MKLITIFELAAKSEGELRVLYREVFKVAARGDRESLEHQNALASLENIHREMNSRALRP